MEGSGLSGVVEVVTRRTIRGWVTLGTESEESKLVIIVEFVDWKTEVLPVTPRANGLKGFEVDLPAVYRDLSWAEFVSRFRRVFARWRHGGQMHRQDIPLNKSVLSAAVEDAQHQILERRRRIAVLLRTHVDTPKVRHLAAQLSRIACIEFIVCADITRRDINVGSFQHVKHDLKWFAALGLDVRHPMTMWICGDYPFYAAAIARPEIDFFLMLEFDVALASEGHQWLEDFATRITDPDEVAIDFFAPYVGDYSPGRGWYDHARLVGQFDIIKKAVFPVIGLSRAAIFHLLAARLIESRPEIAEKNRQIDPLKFGMTYCEVFVPSVLAQSRQFLCVDGRNMNLQNKLEHFTVHRPLCVSYHVPETLSGVFAHPVLDEADYPKKVQVFQGAENSPEDWLRFSESLSVVPAEVLATPIMASVRSDPRYHAQ